MADLDTLRPEVRSAFSRLNQDVHLSPQSFMDWTIIRAELVRLAADNCGMHKALCEHDELCEQLTAMRLRAEKSEAELAALKARIAEAPVASVRVDDRMHVSIGARSNAVDLVPLHTKHVALVKVEE